MLFLLFNREVFCKYARRVFVNIEQPWTNTLAHERLLGESSGERRWRIQDGVNLSQCSTLPPHWLSLWHSPLFFRHAEILFTGHSFTLSHPRAHVHGALLQKGKTGSWINPVLSIWFIHRVTWVTGVSANHCMACLARWVWHFIHRILPSNG